MPDDSLQLSHTWLCGGGDWHDSLNPDTYYDGWKVNERLAITGLPTIRRIAKEESVVWKALALLADLKEEVRERGVMVKVGVVIFNREANVAFPLTELTKEN